MTVLLVILAFGVGSALGYGFHDKIKARLSAEEAAVERNIP